MSAPTTAVSNGISEGSLDAADTIARHEQSWNVNMESNSSISRQELSSIVCSLVCFVIVNIVLL